uniref:Uncharacterized protein n=1 Tax=Candidatus Kentrum sp. TC TaxID=2126339 RepID=A0A450ZVM0_9GAMM|nr:MAG: hypothetical protein BECKTC1821F_GA0114240_102027 [Candidatus Kentron sp. TC]
MRLSRLLRPCKFHPYGGVRRRRASKDKIREIALRPHNLDRNVVEKVDRIIRGAVNYFGKPAPGRTLLGGVLFPARRRSEVYFFIQETEVIGSVEDNVIENGDSHDVAGFPHLLGDVHVGGGGQ